MDSRGRTISQAAFDSMVSENIEDLGMNAEEALEDAIETLTLQGVDLSGIVKYGGGAKEDPMIQTLDKLKKNTEGLKSVKREDSFGENVVDLLSSFIDLCSVEGSENVSIATKNGAVQLLTFICGLIEDEDEKALVLALRALSTVLYDYHNTQTFCQIGGPDIVLNIIRRNRNSHMCLEAGFDVVVKASTGNEIIKESFMELKIDELFVEIMKDKFGGSCQNLYEAMRVLLTPDDNRVLASQVFAYARRFAKIGMAEILVDALHSYTSPSILVPVCCALKAVAVNDEICRSISEKGGVDVILDCLDASSEDDKKILAKSCCSLLCKLAGSDANKTAIIMKDGLDKLIKLSSTFPDDASVIQEVMAVITILSLRSPENAARAVKAGAGDLAIEAMQKFPKEYQMQRQGCQMVRNLVARNTENRSILLGNGIETMIRRAKRSHESCRVAATDALRDLGVEGYNK